MLLHHCSTQHSSYGESYMLKVGVLCSNAAQQLAEQLQGVYLLDKKASETVRAGVLEALGLLVEVAPQVSIHPPEW